MKKLKFTEKIALRFLQKRFSSSMHIMLDKDGGWNISLRKNYRVWIHQFYPLLLKYIFSRNSDENISFL